MPGSLTRIVPFAAALAVALPATAVAQEPAPASGGALAPASAGPPAPFTLSGGGNALVGRKVRFCGTVAKRLAGRAVVVQFLDPATQRWSVLARTGVAAD